MKKKLLIVCNVDWFYISHRLGIGKAAVENGYDVFVAAEDTGRADEIRQTGVKFIDLKFSRSGTNVIEELKVLRKFWNLYKSVAPDIVHHVTLKPVVYGSLVAKWQKIHGVVNAIAGLGYNFTSERKGTVFSALIKLMKYGFNRDNVAVIFQNQTDYEDLKKTGVLAEGNKVFFTKGSGVDLNQYHYIPLPKEDRINILFPTRMLWDKGVMELKKATEILKDKYKGKVRFVLAGLADDGNKAGVTSEFLTSWSDGDYVDWVGYQNDMPKIFAESEIVTLPSYYREGMPKSLIEACAIGRAIVTTDSIGCRDCVENGYNGFIVQPRDYKELANALERLILSRELRETFSQNARKKAEREFDVKSVINTHLQIYRELSD
ncbi:MAG: glycosyltransferase family 1 protein [Sphingobacterium multivorum]|jgi:glycosyltransferase involved in cell wall biosynthesis|nr:glycosyltransferase family 1 protein [Sphingobacterium multivorum]